MNYIEKHKTTLLILISTFTLFACTSTRERYIIVPQSDGITFNGTINHLWLGLRNPIYINAAGELIDIWSDNGQIIHDTTTHNHIEYFFVKPSKKGSVRVFISLITKNSQNTYDTITHHSKFKAIEPPQLSIVIDTTLLKNKFILKYHVINKSTSKPLMDNKRYGYGGLTPSISVFSENEKIGEIEFYHEKEEIQELLKKGNRISIPPIAIYDSRTGLFLFTNTYDYKYK